MSALADGPIESLARFFSGPGSFLKRRSKILVACSGGPDSVALVVALRSLAYELPHEFHIGHVNHALRGRESKRDEDSVRALALKVGWRFHRAGRPLNRSASGNLEERARDARYQALIQMAEKNGCAAILTAHNQDDQVETVLMNLFRGMGPDGLAGMRPVRALAGTRVKLGRPFLDVSKKELVAWVRVSKVGFRHDRTNADQAFIRNWVRHRLTPLVESRFPGFARRLGRVSALAADEKDHWSRLLDGLESQLLKNYKGGRLLDLKGLLRYSAAVQRRFLRRTMGSDLLTFDAVERLRNWMSSPPTNGRLFQLRKGWIVERLSKSKGSPSARLFWLKKIPAN